MGPEKVVLKVGGGQNNLSYIYGEKKKEKGAKEKMEGDVVREEKVDVSLP